MASHSACPLSLTELTSKACGFTSRFEQSDDVWRYSAWADGSPLGLTVVYDGPRERCDVWASVRTSSWNWDGERTDLHDVIAHTIVVWLYCEGHSCSVWEVANPAAYIPTEVYSYVIRFDQGPLSDLRDVKQLDIHVAELIFNLRMAWNTFWRTFWKEDTRPRDSVDYPRALGWAKRVARGLKEKVGSQRNSYTWRFNPTWMHFLSIKSRFIVVNCGPLVSMLRAQIVRTEHSRKRLYGQSATLVKAAGMLNVISHDHGGQSTALVRRLERQTSDCDHALVAAEDRLFVLGKRHLAIRVAEGGRRVYEAEASRIALRHREEIAFLSPALKWVAQISPGRFESLITELLAVEPGVSRVRQVGPTNQPDGGRDHVAEWYTSPLQGTKIQEGRPPTDFRRVLVQCKAYTGTVGAADVSNIRDTVEHYDASGFLLAVASQLSVGLFDRLDKLRRERKMFVEWWERPQLEERLRMQPDILARYADIVVQSETEH